MPGTDGERLYAGLTGAGVVLSLYRPGGPCSGSLGPVHAYLRKDSEGVFWLGSIRRRCPGGPWVFAPIDPIDLASDLIMGGYGPGVWLRVYMDRLEGAFRVYYSDLLSRIRTHRGIEDILGGIRERAFWLMV